MTNKIIATAVSKSEEPQCKRRNKPVSIGAIFFSPDHLGCCERSWMAGGGADRPRRMYSRPWPPLNVSSAQTPITPAEAKAIAEEAYIFGFAIVERYGEDALVGLTE